MRHTRVVLAVLLVSLAARLPAFAQAPVIEYYHVDALGSVRAVTDASGAVVRTHNYHPFGEGVGVTAAGDPMGFTGKPRDRETGLDYFGARYYAQRAGRFSTVDPHMGTEAAILEPQRWNRYAYVLNSPLVLVDPDGMDPRVAGWTRLLQSAPIQAFLKSAPVQRFGQLPIVRGSASAVGRVQSGLLNASLRLFSPRLPASTAPIDANKLNHIFGKAQHGLDVVVSQFGSREAAYAAIDGAIQSAVLTPDKRGVFEQTVNVAGHMVTVTGRIVDGVARIGTAFITAPK